MAEKEIIVIRKITKAPEASYGGGMWKVAYADFVTAMMAFFLMLWILNSAPKDTLEGVAKYFTTAASKNGAGDEAGVMVDSDTGIPADETKSKKLLKDNPVSASGTRMTKFYGRRDMTSEDEVFSSIVNNIQKNVELQDFSNNVAFEVTDEGLKIQVMDGDNRPMFKPGTDMLEPYMKQILTVIGKIIRSHPNYLTISGHTAAMRADDTGVDLWSLSVLRANQVRRFLTEDLLQDAQIVKVEGRADREPLDSDNPYDQKNIRISILLLKHSALGNHQSATPKTAR